MRILVQRVKEASVEVDGRTVGRIGPGLLALIGIRNGDTKAEADFLIDKLVNLRIFEDINGKFNHSALEIGADILAVSQFTLYGDCRKGRRPSFTEAAVPKASEPLYNYVAEAIAKRGLKTETGIFGAEMNVNLINEGPVTLMLEKEAEA